MSFFESFLPNFGNSAVSSGLGSLIGSFTGEAGTPVQQSQGFDWGETIGSALTGQNPLFNTLIASGLGGAAALAGNDLKRDQFEFAKEQQAFENMLAEKQLAQALEIAGMRAAIQKMGLQNDAFTNLINANQTGRTNEATALRDLAQLMQNALTR